MERVMTPDDRIRRAEEIYARRQSLREKTKKARVNVAEKPKNYRLLKGLALQVAISITIYFMFYLVNTTNYSFSENVLNKVRELVTADYDFKGLYNSVVQNINNYIYSDEQKTENENNEEQEGDGQNEEGNVSEGQGENSENQGEDAEGENINLEAENTANVNEDESLTQSEVSKTEESETERIKKEYAFSLPVSGTVSSEYGDREVTSSVMTAYHKGIDIGADTGTPIYAATDGEVVIARESPSYGKYIMLQNNEVKTVYAHCSELLVGIRRQSVKRTRDRKGRSYTEKLQGHICTLK